MHRRALPRAIPESVQQVFRVLLDVNADQHVGAILRVAGGWVRDQLLGVDSNDIDITIETPEDLMQRRGNFITGADFANAIRIYHEVRNLPTHTISVIKTNPEKSKHIETAQMTINGVPVEFCHLRQDEYTESSRVPVVRRGTPLEDAMRRDFTVNAMFYNLHTREVEDFTGSGFEDMEARVLRTPLSPRETFLDDPLRLLRGIRFSGQLGYALHDDVLRAASDAEVLAALQTKVARERIGIELGKMLKGNDPTRCIGYLSDLHLLQQSVLFEAYLSKKRKGEIDRIISALPEDQLEADSILKRIRFMGCELYALLLADGVIEVPKGNDRLLASMFFLTAGLYGDAPAEERLDRLPALATNGVKLPGSVAETVNKMISAYQALRPVAQAIVDCATKAASRPCPQGAEDFIFVGEVREAIFSALQQTAKGAPPCAFPCTLGAALADASTAETLGDNLRVALAAIEADGAGSLRQSATRAAVVRGQDIPDALGVEKKHTGFFLTAQMRFLLHHPLASADEVISHLRGIPPPPSV